MIVETFNNCSIDVIGIKKLNKNLLNNVQLLLIIIINESINLLLIRQKPIHTDIQTHTHAQSTTTMFTVRSRNINMLIRCANITTLAINIINVKNLTV